jgi:hypothetical protein
MNGQDDERANHALAVGSVLWENTGEREPPPFRRITPKRSGEDVDRPLCPRNPHHRLWRRRLRDRVAQWYCPSCGLSVGGTGRHGRRGYGDEYRREAVELIRSGISYRSAVAIMAERHQQTRMMSINALQQWVLAASGGVTRTGEKARRWNMMATWALAVQSVLTDLAAEETIPDDLRSRARKLLEVQP